jgi:hypothetical protein
VEDGSIETLAKNCKGLASLDISLCKKLTEASAVAITQSCDKLQCFKAAYCQTVVTDTMLIKLAKLCKELKVLDISYCKAVTDEGLEAFHQAQTHFVAFFLNGLENISTISITNMLRHSYPVLEHLELSLLDPVLAAAYVV